MGALGGRLSSLTVKHARKPGMLADGDGLYLQVTRANARSWIFRYYRNGKSREMGLGSLKAVSLAGARLKAAACRGLLADGTDPIAARDAKRTQQALEDARAITFDQCAEAFITAHGAAWKNQKHFAQWKATLRTYVSPVFGSLPVQVVDVALIMKVLEPIWTTKPETAARLRGRIESVLNWAKARGYRSGENPALWKGHLSNLLPAHSKIAKVKHHAALPYDQTSHFMDTLRRQDGIAPLALEFAILTAARTGEIIGARWAEIDLETKVWTVPASRMKNGREHRVPLSVEALAVLTKVSEGEPDEFVFAGRKKRPLSNMAFLMLLRRMGHDKLTGHGFRSTFRDWAAERTNFQAEIAEAALGHVVGNKVEAAYRRGDFFEKRRRLMEAWAQFATTAPSDAVVVSLREATI
ncbi:MAG: integrase arm-type DNA-binding domain-containing protein [Pseudolabrys sp.]